MDPSAYQHTCAGHWLKLLTIPETISILSISRSTFYELVQQGKIPLRKLGGASRVRSDDLDAYIQNLPAFGETKVGDHE